MLRWRWFWELAVVWRLFDEDEFKKAEKAKKQAAPIQKKWEEDRKKAADKKGERPYLYSRMSRSVNNIPIANV
ncbi:hypothetical protein PG987_009851 [Apiospora arundinis]